MVEYIEQLNLEDYIGAYNSRQVVVLTDRATTIKDPDGHRRQALAFHYRPGENPQCEIANTRPDHTQDEAVVSHCHVFPQSSLAQVANHSYPDEWDEA